MPKRPPKPQILRLALAFPDPRLADALDLATRAECAPGELPNRSAWVRDAIRRKLKSQGISIPA